MEQVSWEAEKHGLAHEAVLRHVMRTRTYSTAFRAILSLIFAGGFVACYLANRSNARLAYRTHRARVAPVPQAALCGRPNDEQVHIPPNWVSFVPPARGASYADPVFGCTIVRLTDALQEGVAEHNYTATLKPMSPDDP